jgi:hypothetical protein
MKTSSSRAIIWIYPSTDLCSQHIQRNSPSEIFDPAPALELSLLAA